MLFTKDGDLYFQDGNKLPVKLTHIVKSLRPPSYVRNLIIATPYYTFLGYAHDDFGIQVSPFKISDDNQKVIFSEGDGNIYSINSDGTQKQTIISSNWQTSFETGTSVEELDFVPQTHIVYVKARRCEKEEQPYICSTSIFLIDANTGKIKKLDYLGKLVEHEHFGIKNNIRFSPNGKMLAVGTKEGITIFTLDGEVIRQNILPFVSEFEIFPSLFWLPDSSGFVAALPDALADVAMWDHTTAYTVWRYSLNDNSAVQISFDPPVIQYYFEVSPDGNWMVYYGGIYESPYYLYLGNLTDGDTMRLGTAGEQGDMLWSPDSKYFLSTIGIETLDGLVLRPMPPAFSWVDARRFSATRFSLVNGDEHGQYLVGEIRDDGTFFYDTGFSYPLYNLLLMKPKR